MYEPTELGEVSHEAGFDEDMAELVRVGGESDGVLDGTREMERCDEPEVETVRLAWIGSPRRLETLRSMMDLDRILSESCLCCSKSCSRMRACLAFSAWRACHERIGPRNGSKW